MCLLLMRGTSDSEQLQDSSSGYDSQTKGFGFNPGMSAVYLETASGKEHPNPYSLLQDI